MTASDPFPGNELSTDDWEKLFWKDGDNDPYFHLKAPHKTLIKYYSTLFENERKSRVFLPLCGKSKDILFLAEKGHEVVGVEFSRVGVETFFSENNLKYSASESGNFVVYKSTGDKDITILRGDFFAVKPELCGKFDVFWDRGSLAAINRSQRRDYADVMFKLMKPGCKYLLQVPDYDGSKYGGPPHNVSEDSLKNTLGEKCTFQVLEEYSTDPPGSLKGLEWKIHVYLLEPKQASAL